MRIQEMTDFEVAYSSYRSVALWSGGGQYGVNVVAQVTASITTLDSNCRTEYCYFRHSE